MKRRRLVSRRLHRGFTLIELLLVLGLLVAFAVFAWPRFDQILARAEHRSAAEQIQSTLWRLRLEAIHSGSPQWFRYCPGTGEYEIASLPYDEVKEIDFDGSLAEMGVPQTEDEEMHMATDPSLEAMEAMEDHDLAIEEDGLVGEGRERMQLENAIVFLAPGDAREEIYRSSNEALLDRDVLSSSEAQWPEVDAELGEVFTESTQAYRWSEPIMFYPDGRADEAHIVLQAPSGHTIEVTVSAMAGHIRIGPRNRPLQRMHDEMDRSLTDEMEPSLADEIDPALTDEMEPAFPDEMEPSLAEEKRK